MIPKPRMAALVSVLVFCFAFAVYMLTLTPTVPFWDSGEFIAVANILGVPHPPGTPFFVLLARVATLVPWASVAQRVNALSALSAALTVWLTYLTCLRLIRLAQGTEREAWHEWVAVAAAGVGALMLAFSDGFWENSVEAEVYQMMSLAQVLVFWLGLRWWEAHDKKPTVGPLLLATYVMWLCVGLHLGVGTMGAPLLLLAFLVDRPVAMLFLMPFISLLRVPAGLEHLAGAVIVLSVITNITFVWKRKLPGWMAAAGALVAIPGLLAAESDANFTMFSALAATAGVLGPMVWMAFQGRREGRVLLLALFLMVAGYSTHLYLPIRAAQHPAVNEGAPATWDKMRDLLERKQYGEMKPLERRAALGAQLDKEFFRYLRRQWVLVGPDDYDRLQTSRAAHAGDSGPKAWFWNLIHNLWLLFPPGAFLPLALGLLGGWWQYRREKKSFALTFFFLGISTVGMIFFLNFTDHEVRDRDYFFQSGFHGYCMWIALGMARLVDWVRESFESESTRRLATVGATALLSLQPFLLVSNLWFLHDRSHNYIARDYAYNMLATLKPNSFMFTNGDNDTFPLWYIQQVEGFRKDVRIVNLSLLNTDWYIRQLRDEEPKVPIDLDDKKIDVLGAGAFSDDKGNIIYTNEFMVHHILEEAKKDSGWVKQPYFAVTVPNQFGYEPYLRQEGIVQEVMHDSSKAGFDEPATTHALYDVYKYRGLIRPDGTWDPHVYKDENAQNLSKNYAFAHMELAMHYRRQREFPKAISEMQYVERMFPNWVEALIPLGGIYIAAGDSAKAWDFYDRLVQRVPGSAEAHYYRGATLGYRGRYTEALDEFRAAQRLNPNLPDPYYDEFQTLWNLGRQEEGLGVLQGWLERHPNDQEGIGMLNEARARLGQGNAVPPGPPGLAPPRFH
jgi:tetratricopeptide (TPR) repeat protein